MSSEKKSIVNLSSENEIDQFLEQAQALSKNKRETAGRLVFAMDATYSREPTWDMACQIQSEMFLASNQTGNLQIKLAYYGGFDTFKVSNWLSSSTQLLKLMSSVHCRAGKTQIARLLRYVLKLHKTQPVDALVFVGDCMEESADELADLAGQLGLVGVPMFIFQEGGDPLARRIFRHMCELSKGAYCAFDSGSAEQLKKLLGAVAVYASAGKTAYIDYVKNKNIAGLLE